MWMLSARLPRCLTAVTRNGMFSGFMERGEEWLVFKGALNDLGNLSKRFDTDPFSKQEL